MKKCPPGVICLENVTLFFIIFIIIIIWYFYFSAERKQLYNENNNALKTNQINSNREIIITQIPNYPYTNLIPPPVPGDVLLNPYVPPLRDERYLIPQLNVIPPGTIPINISTNVGSVDTSYRQIGMLNPLNRPNKDNILPLMGRPIFTNRDKWQYYTIGNQYNSIKLPVIVKGRSGSNEYGVDRLMNGDTVYIEGLNDTYRVTVYDNDTIKYLPFI
jgi:cbb3-type cytochrome oxidase subunit 3